MARPCTVCTSLDRDAIDLELTGSATLASIAAKHGVTTDSLRRHKARHVTPALVAVARRRLSEAGAVTAYQRLEELVLRANRLLDRAERKGALVAGTQNPRPAPPDPGDGRQDHGRAGHPLSGERPQRGRVHGLAGAAGRHPRGTRSLPGRPLGGRQRPDGPRGARGRTVSHPLAADLAAGLDPVEMCRRIGLTTPDPWQVDVLRSVERRLALCCGRQVGKSTVAAILAVHAATLHAPGRSHFWPPPHFASRRSRSRPASSSTARSVDPSPRRPRTPSASPWRTAPASSAWRATSGRPAATPARACSWSTRRPTSRTTCSRRSCR